MKSTGHVYFAFARKANAVKIGHTTNMRARFSALQTGCPEPLEIIGAIPGTMDDEAAVHVDFDHLRTHGEWFHASHELLRWIDANAQHRTQATHTTEDVARILHVSDRKVIAWIESGELKADRRAKYPISWRVSDSDLREFFDARSNVKPASKRPANRRITNRTTENFFA